MELRLLFAALARRRGFVALAVVAIAIGVSVACALLHVSRDVSRKLTRELRALGPNLVLLPRKSSADIGPRFLDETSARSRLAAASLEGAPLLLVTARLGERSIPVVGADLEAARRMHPSWRLEGGAQRSMLGARLAKTLGASVGDTLRVSYGGESRTLVLPVTGVLEGGGTDDEAWWVPLAEAQRLSGREGQVSLVQSRISDPSQAEAAVRVLEEGGAVRAVLLRALSSAEAELLVRMRRLMALVTVAVLLAAGLCAYGTLTDLALERRREIALLKALGATRREVVRLFGAESAAIGLIGGLVGFGIGVVAAQVIGVQVFHSPVAPQWGILPIVIALSMLVALLAGLGPIRLALAVEPAPALKEE